jgi:hypothetical protein
MRFPDSKVYGTYFTDRFFASRYDPVRDPEAKIALANRYYDHAPEMDRGKSILNH